MRLHEINKVASFKVRGGEDSGAAFSECDRYRWALWRRWEPTGALMVIGLNPSTADEHANDPTIRRCIRFAADLGYGSLWMLNLFAFRATDPRVMKREADPVGRMNDETLVTYAMRAGLVLAAWGTHGGHKARDLDVLELLYANGIKVHCLGETKHGHPRHPLYLRSDTKPAEFLGSRS